MTRPSLRVFEGGKGRTPSNVEIHAFAKDMDLESEERKERDRERWEQFWTIVAFAALIRLFLWVVPR